MPKYQIILSSAEQIPDDEFQRFAMAVLAAFGSNTFSFVNARNLEGIREEVWKLGERLKESYGTETEVNETFKEIQNLFQLD